jgi:vitamin B12 transporter
MESRMRRMLLCSALILPAFAAQAQDVPSDAIALPERVVTATRIPTLAEQIPAGVTVIDRQTIEARGYTTLADARQTVPGVHVVQSGGPGGNASVFVRGTDSNQVLVLRDGVPVNDPSDPDGAYNFGVETLADVDRIEVVRGPMSSLWGSGAIGGVINLITRQGSGGPHATAEIAGGLPQASLLGATLSGAEGMFDYNAGVQSQTDIGSDNTPRRESVYTGARNGDRTQTASINLGITPIAGTRFYAALRYRVSVFGLDELGSPAYDATDYTGRDRSILGRVGVTSKLFDGVWETGLSVAHLDSLRRYSEPLEAADPNQTSSYSRYNGRRTAVDWTNTVHIADWGPARATALTFGAEHQEDSSSSYLNESGLSSFDGYSYPYTYLDNINARAQHTAGNVGLQSTLFRRLTLTGGVREEAATYGGDAFTWRAGGVLALPEIWSRLKLSYGTAFVAPSLYDLFGVDSYGYVGNPALRPERSEGGEVGWAVDVPVFGRHDGATLDVTYFANRIRDLIQIVYAPDDLSSTPQNVAQARINGTETSLTLRPASWAEMVLSWTYTDARDDTGAPLHRRPRDQASADLRLTPLPGLSIAPELVYASGAYDYPVDDSGMQSYVVGMTKGGLIFNLTVSYAVTPKVTLFVDARNIGGSRYEPASGFQTPGPSFLAGARLKY